MWLVRHAARAERNSAVWGNDPMVVVGSGGSERRTCWAAARTSERVDRRGSEFLNPATRWRTASSTTRGERHLASRAIRLVSSSSATASRPSRNPLAKVASSGSFSYGEANQGSTSSERLLSARRLTGTCISEHEVDTTTSAATSAS